MDIRLIFYRRMVSQDVSVIPEVPKKLLDCLEDDVIYRALISKDLAGGTTLRQASIRYGKTIGFIRGIGRKLGKYS